MRCKSPAQADKILAAAAQLFATHRFHEARMEDIAALAEVAKGTLYRYFRDKDELYLALLRLAGDALQERLAPCHDAALDPRRRLVLLVGAIITYFDEQPHLFDLITHAEAMQRPGAEFPWQQTRSQTFDLTQDIFRAGTAGGLFRIEDPELAMLLLLGGIRAVLRFQEPPRPADVAERIVDGFLGGYLPKAGNGRFEAVAPSRRSFEQQVIDAASSPAHNS
jgi:AcrR family transcriptional regulator